MLPAIPGWKGREEGVFPRSTREARLQVRLTPSLEEAGHCQHSTQQRRPEEHVDLLCSSALLWCSSVAEEARSSMLPSEVRAGQRRLEPGQGVPSPSPRGIQVRRWLSCPSPPPPPVPLPPRSMFAPGRTGTPFGIFSVCCLPTYALTWTPSFILCAFLIRKQPNILGFLGHISFECCVPLLPPQGVWTWAWDVGGYSGKAEDSEGPGPGLGNFHQTQQEARAQQLVERS